MCVRLKRDVQNCAVKVDFKTIQHLQDKAEYNCSAKADHDPVQFDSLLFDAIAQISQVHCKPF